jgi:hypothetical protein
MILKTNQGLLKAGRRITRKVLDHFRKFKQEVVASKLIAALEIGKIL